jgi:hypothetical protein
MELLMGRLILCIYQLNLEIVFEEKFIQILAIITFLVYHAQKVNTHFKPLHI